MNGISGLNFYESLNKFIMGFLIFVLFVGSDSDWFTKPLFIISAYIVGCICQALVQRTTKQCCTLKEDEIKEAHDKVYGKNDNKDKGDKAKDDKAKDDENKDDENKNKCKEAYLKAYYKVAKAGLLMNIPVLEALENFMRNLMFILPVYIFFFVVYEIFILCKCTPLPMIEELQKIDCIYIVLLFVVLIVAFFEVKKLRRYYQETIYKLVWEGDKYLDEINNKGKKEEKQN